MSSFEQSRSEIDKASAENIASIADSYVQEAVRLGQFATPEEARAAVESNREAVEADHSIKINMSAESLNRLLTVGSHETYWHATEIEGVASDLGSVALHNGKNLHNKYRAFRQAAETGLAEFVPAEARTIQPRYGAVSGGTERDAVMGPAPGYGNWWIQLQDVVSERTVYNYSDSHASVRETKDGFAFDASHVLSEQDAVTAKAISNLTAEYNKSQGYLYMGRSGLAVNVDPSKLMDVAGRGAGGYVEAVIYDDIKPETIAGIGGFITNASEVSAAGQLIKDHPEVLASLQSLRLGASTPALVRGWLEKHVKPGVISTPEDGEAKAELPEVFQEFGIDPNMEYEEIARVIHKTSAMVGQSLRGSIRYVSPPKDMNSSDRAIQWDGYIKSLQARLQIASPQEATNIQNFIALQQARLFFKPSPLPAEV